MPNFSSDSHYGRRFNILKSTMDTIVTVLREAISQLRESGVENPEREANYLMALALHTDRLGLIRICNREIQTDELQRFRNLVSERSQRKPFAHLKGVALFYGREFQVDSRVLIPRPETEELVELALKHIPPRGKILDLATGSGCIGITVAAEHHGLTIHLSDISPEALENARENARSILGERSRYLQFFLSDLYEGLPGIHYDLIVSNPPYIFPDEMDQLQPEVRLYDPHLALTHPDPPALYHGILSGGKMHLTQNGWMLLELSPRLAPYALNSAQRIFRRAEILKDLSGNDRFLCVCQK